MIALKKGPKVKVVSQLMEWNGSMVLDIRTYVIASKGPNAGEWIPTAKGIQIPADRATRFMDLASSDLETSFKKGVKTKVKTVVKKGQKK